MAKIIDWFPKIIILNSEKMEEKKRLIVKERNQKENENMFGYKR